MQEQEIQKVLEEWYDKREKNLNYHHLTRIKRYLELKDLRIYSKGYRDEHDVFYENAYDNNGNISNWRYLPKEHEFWDKNRHVSLGERRVREYPSMPLTNDKPEVLEAYLRKIGL